MQRAAMFPVCIAAVSRLAVRSRDAGRSNSRSWNWAELEMVYRKKVLNCP
jgi:hypothetical protein